MKRIVMHVQWLDTASLYGWHAAADIPSATGVLCDSVGMLYARDKHGIRLIQSSTEFDKYAEVIEIPTANIRRVRRLATIETAESE